MELESLIFVKKETNWTSYSLKMFSVLQCAITLTLALNFFSYVEPLNHFLLDLYFGFLEEYLII